MIRTVVSIVLFVLLIVGCIWIYRNVNHEQVPGGGEVVVRSSPDRDQMETGATYIGDKPVVEAHPTPSRSDAPGTINTEPVADYGKAANPSDDTTRYDLNGRTDTREAQQKYNDANPAAKVGRDWGKNPNYYPAQPNSVSPYASTSYGNDTIAPNPPNGLAFAGTGAYQWYRQGDLTWRVDSKSGASCIDYATMEEWSKPIVYSHGCGGSSRWHHRHERY